MPIPAYVGLQGHGKTYEVVSSVIVPAIQKGRRIVTNIAGVKLDAIRAYILETSKQVVEGEIVVIGNKEIESRLFLPFADPPVEETIARPGDLVIVDEAWRVWGTDSKILDEHMIFFREHRHFADPESGYTCDLVVICQSIGDLHRKLKSVVERTFVMQKLKELGLDNGYTVHQYEKASIRKSSLINHWRKFYDPKIFALYDSYAKKNAQESIVDSRQNIFKNPALWRALGVLAFICTMSGFFLYRFFSGGMVKETPEDAKKAAAASKPITPALSERAAAKAAAGLSEKWQQVGWYARGAVTIAVMRSDDGRYRYVYDPPNFRTRGIDFSARIDGEGVAPWTGTQAKSGGSLKVFK